MELSILSHNMELSILSHNMELSILSHNMELSILSHNMELSITSTLHNATPTSVLLIVLSLPITFWIVLGQAVFLGASNTSRTERQGKQWAGWGVPPAISHMRMRHDYCVRCVAVYEITPSAPGIKTEALPIHVKEDLAR